MNNWWFFQLIITSEFFLLIVIQNRYFVDVDVTIRAIPNCNTLKHHDIMTFVWMDSLLKWHITTLYASSIHKTFVIAAFCLVVKHQITWIIEILFTNHATRKLQHICLFCYCFEQLSHRIMFWIICIVLINTIVCDGGDYQSTTRSTIVVAVLQ